MISYAITVHNEGEQYLKPLFTKLIQYIHPEDEIVVVDDFSDDVSTISILDQFKDKIRLVQHKLNNDFATHKNFLNSQCKGSHVFQIDGDELPHDTLIKVLPEILMMNPTIDLFNVPRINLVPGITQRDIDQWRWHIDSEGRINFPDRQSRIYKNKPTIVWEGKVHERIKGDMLHADLPADENYCLLHVKTIDRQRDQNNFYGRIS